MEVTDFPSKFTCRYQLHSLVGEGGGGSVYCAWDAQLSRTVAVKRLKPDALAPDTAQSALQEAVLLASLHHPNIVAVYDFWCDEQGACFVMEFIEGETVDQIVNRGTFTLEDFTHLAEQSLEGLIAAHHVGLIHRDLKPANLMLTWMPSGAFHVKILDFGLAKFITAPCAQTVAVDGTVYGSILTMAPEQFEKRELDARTDLYSLGCVFYAALTGATPFTGDTAAAVICAHLQGQSVPIDRLRADLPPAVCAWVMRLFALHPADRFQTASDALAAFRDALAGAAPMTAIAPAPSSPLRRKMGLMIAIAALLLAGAMAFWVVHTRLAGQKAQLPDSENGKLPNQSAAAQPGPGAFDAHDVAALRKHLGEQVTIEGRTVSATKNKALNVRNLNFDLDPKAAVSLVFPLDSGGHFSKEALNPYVEKRVRTTGILEESDGALQIIVRNMSQMILVGE